VTRALVAAMLVAACARQDPRADDTARRLAAIEQQLAAQQRELEELRTAQSAAPEMLIERIDALAAQLGKLEQQRRPVRRPEPDRAATYAVPVGSSPSYGPRDAKVTLVMAMDFACPYCRKAWDTVDELRKRYGKDLRIVYKAMIVHAAVATLAAEAACAANHQGKWRELAELLWTRAFDLRASGNDVYDRAHVDALAAAARLDMARYRADLAGPCPLEVKQEQALLVRLGVYATPSFFINGRYMSGAMPIEDFAKLIDEERAKADAAIARGVPADRYYDDEIVGKGLVELVTPSRAAE